MTTWAADILGEGYQQTTLALGADLDGEGEVVATVVRREPREPVTGVFLFVHGFADYVFQTGLADHVAGLGLAFYGLDLRKCGRSRKPGQTAHYVSDLALYDADLEGALAVVREAHPGLPVVLAAHSTGGLILPLWLDREPQPDVVGVVLNSPWLDLQGKAYMRTVLTPVLALVSRRKPFATLPPGTNGYGTSLHQGSNGEWDYDLALKPHGGFPLTAGWITAIRRGQARLHRGLDVRVPVLVLRSTASFVSKTYLPEVDAADVILDVKQIARWSGAIGRDVTVVAVEGARHDVFLSTQVPRDAAYEETDRWLRSRVAVPLSV